MVQRQQQQKSKRFLELMRGASAQDWWWLKNYHLLEEKVAVYDPNSCEIHPVAAYGVPWPIVWVLSRYNKKHIWASGKMPSVQKVEQEIRQFNDRVKWRWFFRHSQSSKPEITFKSHTRCREVVDGGLQCWLDRLQRCLVEDAKRAIKHAKWTKRKWSNVTPLIRWGLKLLRSSDWKTLPTDKTGAFVLVLRHQEAEIHQKIFQKSMYMQVADERRLMDLWYKSYFRAVNKVQKLEEDEALASQLRKTPTLPGAKLPSKLSVTVKSTKPQGEVSVRNLHLSGGYAFKGLGVWLQKQLMNKLCELHHLAQSAHQVSMRVKNLGVRLDTNHRLVRIDIREFFICGQLRELADEALKAFESDHEAKKLVMEEVMNLLLGSQFVSSEAADATYQVIEGSGMGLPQSAGIADSAFYHKAERGLVDEQSLRETGIDLLIRYRDDILILSHDYGKFVAWFQVLKARSGFFRVQCEEIVRFCECEDREVQFLQFRVQMNARSRKLRLIPHCKNIAMPLESSSAHAPAVHNWPKQHVNAMCKLATDDAARRTAKQCIMARFRKHLTPEEVLAEMMEAGTPRNFTTKEVRSSNVLWITLSWHPIWKFARFGKTIRKFCEHDVRYLLDQAFCRVFDVRVSWKNGLMYSSALVSRL